MKIDVDSVAGTFPQFVVQQAKAIEKTPIFSGA
jgi:hypothetical protein